MKYFSSGWACTLADIFVRFPYEKFKTLSEICNTKIKKLSLIKKVFQEGTLLMLEDIVEHNVTIKLQGVGYQSGELHMEPIKDDDFINARKHGKFQDIDFLESLFTGYQIYLFIHNKHDNFLHRKKYVVYTNKYLKDKLTEYTNKGRAYC